MEIILYITKYYSIFMKTYLVFLMSLLIGQQSPMAFANIQFETNNATIASSYRSSLAATATALKTSGKHYRISGYAAHSEGTASYNMTISMQRAKAVRDYLIRLGVKPAQLSLKYFGEQNPIGDNSTENGKAMNRRVEFQVQN